MSARIIALSIAFVGSLMLSSPAASQGTLDELARDVDRAESMRAVKNLQRTYAHYSQYGLWNEMGALFADDAQYIFDGETVSGRDAITAHFTRTEGDGEQGLAPGAVHTQLIEHPVVNLSVDGESAKGRWYGFFLLSDADGNASIQGGVFENEYVREDGRWKIAVHRFHPQYEGPYETGWKNWKGEDVAILPYHFTPDESGVPIPPAEGVAPKTDATLEQLEERIAVMVDEGLVRNLQAAYGYYVNRRMWDDVVDLFADDGVYEVGGVGVYEGRDGVRKAMERQGPAGLTDGVLNDRLQFDTVVSFAPGRKEAFVRGIEMGILGDVEKNEAFWEINTYVNRFEKEDGLWKVREMRVFPVFRSTYAEGWGKSRIVETAQTGALAPDRELPSADAGEQDRLVPDFVSTHPVTGAAVAAPQGMKLVATEPLTGVIDAPEIVRSGDLATRMGEAARKLAVAKAYDGAEHVSVAYGFYADDSQWDWLSEIFGNGGTKQIPFAGYYTSFPRISKALFLEYGDPVSLDAKKASIAFHWRIQPVIIVAPDGRSARLRTYLFHPNTSKTNPSTLFGAIYPDDHLILEDGIWRLWNLSLDEPYFEMPDWKRGWSGVNLPDPEPQAPRAAPPPAGPNAPPRPKRYFGAELVAQYRPDVPITELGVLQEHFRGGTGEPWDWPQILPMWWGYKNPVSGRQPELFLPDCVPCEYAPEMSMTRHGYILPSTDPVKSVD
ncbi:MAG TPA: nuclear transport factor 2 family protein [Pseudomonadales bacterium]